MMNAGDRFCKLKACFQKATLRSLRCSIYSEYYLRSSLGRSLHYTTFDDANVETLSSANQAKSIGGLGDGAESRVPGNRLKMI
jgi:hypothetical protein